MNVRPMSVSLSPVAPLAPRFSVPPRHSVVPDPLIVPPVQLVVPLPTVRSPEPASVPPDWFRLLVLALKRSNATMPLSMLVVPME